MSPSSPGASRPAGRLIVVASLAIAVVCAIVYGIDSRGDAAIARIVAPPDGSRQPGAIREHLQDRYEAALAAPRSAEVVGAYCLALHADMFYAPAAQCYALPIELSGGDWQWLYFRSLIAGDLGGGEPLLRDLRAVVEKSPDFAPAWLRLGDAEFKARRYEQAEQAWSRVFDKPASAAAIASEASRAIEVPASAYASLGLARIKLARADAGGALQMLERAVADADRFGSAYRLQAEILSAQGREADATRALARARRLPPFAPYADPMIDRLALESRNSTFLLRLASEADLAINGAWSEFLTRRALQFDPDNPEVVSKLGRVLRTRGQNQEALALFRRYEQMVPGDLQVLAHIGGSLSELGRFSEAEPYLRRAADTLDDSVSHYNLALLLAMTGRVDEAIAEYERALERDAENTAARRNLAAVLVRKGDVNRAERELARIIALDPEDAIAHANLGLVHAQQGDVIRARRALQEALRLAPDLTQAAEALQALR